MRHKAEDDCEQRSSGGEAVQGHVHVRNQLPQFPLLCQPDGDGEEKRLARQSHPRSGGHFRQVFGQTFQEAVSHLRVCQGNFGVRKF